MVRDQLDGILNAIVNKTTNAAGESINARIHQPKRIACGFRNRDLGRFDLDPASAGITHNAVEQKRRDGTVTMLALHTTDRGVASPLAHTIFSYRFLLCKKP